MCINIYYIYIYSKSIDGSTGWSTHDEKLLAIPRWPRRRRWSRLRKTATPTASSGDLALRQWEMHIWNRNLATIWRLHHEIWWNAGRCFVCAREKTDSVVHAKNNSVVHADDGDDDDGDDDDADDEEKNEADVCGRLFCSAKSGWYIHWNDKEDW